MWKRYGPAKPQWQWGSEAEKSTWGCTCREREEREEIQVALPLWNVEGRREGLACDKGRDSEAASSVQHVLHIPCMQPIISSPLSFFASPLLPRTSISFVYIINYYDKIIFQTGYKLMFSLSSQAIYCCTCLYVVVIIYNWRIQKGKKEERPLGFPFIHMVFLLQESLYICIWYRSFWFFSYFFCNIIRSLAILNSIFHLGLDGGEKDIITT